MAWPERQSSCAKIDKSSAYPNRCPERITYLYGQTDKREPQQQISQKNIFLGLIEDKTNKKTAVGLMLTRGSFWSSVWGTAPGRAATSMGLEA